MAKSNKKRTKASVDVKCDVLIIGGGPAGLSAFLWCSKLGLDALLVEKENRYGGQLHSIYNPISDYPARYALDGKKMLMHFHKSVDELAGERRLNAGVVKFDAKRIAATLESGEILTAKTAVIGTGVRRRKLNIPGEAEFATKGILESGAKERKKVAGKRVAIIGGGDAALENALMLAEFAKRIYIIHRRSHFPARTGFLSAARKTTAIEFLSDTIATSIDGNDRVASLSVVNKNKSAERVLPIDAVLIRIGVEPNTEMFRGQLDLDRSGYIIVDHACRTSRLNVFAAGDVANPAAPTIVSAAGTGATAAKTALASIKSS